MLSDRSECIIIRFSPCQWFVFITQKFISHRPSIIKKHDGNLYKFHINSILSRPGEVKPVDFGVSITMALLWTSAGSLFSTSIYTKQFFDAIYNSREMEEGAVMLSIRISTNSQAKIHMDFGSCLVRRAFFSQNRLDGGGPMGDLFADKQINAPRFSSPKWNCPFCSIYTFKLFERNRISPLRD